MCDDSDLQEIVVTATHITVDPVTGLPVRGGLFGLQPGLTPDQIDAALENLAQQVEFLNQATADRSKANMNPTPQNFSKVAEDLANAQRYYDRYTNIIDNPGSSPKP